MATLRAESFADVNILELTVLTADASAGATTITVKSTAGFTVGQPVYIGTRAQDGCELAVVKTVTSGTALELVAALTMPHSKYDPVTGVVGDKLRIYRASNVDGTTPDDASFAVLGVRQIDADQQSTYYTDSTGSSDYWYKLTYYNATTLAETELSASTAVRGDDFGHYASLSEIRSKAGFEGAANLSDQRIDLNRKAAETEINSALSGKYTVPFSPVPEHIHTLTVALGAGLLLRDAYGDSNPKGSTLVKDARTELAGLRTDQGYLTDTAEGANPSAGISSIPDDSTDDARLFEGVWEKF